MVACAATSELPSPAGRGQRGSGMLTDTPATDPGPTRFLLPLGERTVAYAPVDGAALLLDAPLAELSARSLERVLPAVAPPPAPRRGKLSPKLLGLVPTRRCDHACRYCGFAAEAPDGADLEPADAIGALDWFARLCAREGRRELAIELFGGEPLIMPELVERLTLHAVDLGARLGLSPRLGVLTSGATTDSVRALLADHFSRVVVSLDGPPDLHESLRPRAHGGRSYDAALRTIHGASAGEAEVVTRTCVTSESVGQLEAIAEFLLAEANPTEMSFEPLQPSPESERWGLAPPDPTAFVAGFLRAELRLVPAGLRAIHATATLESIVSSFCPVGNDGCIVSPGRTLSACYLRPATWQARGLDLEIGTLGDDGEPSFDPARVAATRALTVHAKPRCRDCFARWHCAGACHVQDTFPGCSPRRSDRCRITRGIAWGRLLSRLGLEDELDQFLRAPVDVEERAV